MSRYTAGSHTGAMSKFLNQLAAAGAGAAMLHGLPKHLQIVNRYGDPKNSLKRQFCDGKQSKKKRGKR